MFHIVVLIYVIHIFGQQCSAQNGCQTIKCNAVTLCDNCAVPFDCQPSCDNPNGKSCQTLTCSAACVCNPGLLRSANGTCVMSSQCPTTVKASNHITNTNSIIQSIVENNGCGENEQFYECGACDGSCINPNVMCAMICRSPGSCGCVTGFVRDTTKNGVCVSEASASCAAQRSGSAV